MSTRRTCSTDILKGNDKKSRRSRHYSRVTSFSYNEQQCTSQSLYTYSIQHQDRLGSTFSRTKNHLVDLDNQKYDYRCNVFFFTVEEIIVFILSRIISLRSVFYTYIFFLERKKFNFIWLHSMIHAACYNMVEYTEINYSNVAKGKMDVTKARAEASLIGT